MSREEEPSACLVCAPVAVGLLVAVAALLGLLGRNLYHQRRM